MTGYVVDPARSDTWTFLRSDLPRNLVMFGDADTPLLVSGTLETGSSCCASWSDGDPSVTRRRPID